MLSADSTTPQAALQALYDTEEDDEPAVSLTEVLTWLGESKRLIALATAIVALAALGVSLLLTPIYTARASFLAPGSQQQSGSSAALAALGSLGSLAAGFAAKGPDDLYVALLRSDSVLRGLDARFDLKKHYGVETYEALRRVVPGSIRVNADKKSGVITVEVDDKDKNFAADLANGHEAEVTKLLGRLVVSEAQLRRVFFEKQLQETKENLVKAEQVLRSVQEKSGVIVLDKQADALITNAALLRAQIAEREVQLKVLRTSSTEQNPAVIRLNSELQGMRTELARMESSQAGSPGSAVDLPVGKLPEAAVDYVRARRELKLQESLLEGMLRQYEIAKLDEAKEGPTLQQVDIALPPDHKSKPSRALFVIVSTLVALFATSAWVIARRYLALLRARDPITSAAWRGLVRAWRIRR